MIKAFVPIALLSFLAAAPASAVPAAPAPVTLGGAHVGDVVQVQNRRSANAPFADTAIALEAATGARRAVGAAMEPVRTIGRRADASSSAPIWFCP